MNNSSRGWGGDIYNNLWILISVCMPSGGRFWTVSAITTYKQKRSATENCLGTNGRNNYSKISMARTSLGSWKFIPDMDSSSH